MLARNVGLLVILEIVYSAVLGLLAGAPLSIGVAVFAVGAATTLPIAPIWISIVSRARRRRRLVAVLSSPLLLTLFAIIFGAFWFEQGSFLFLLALPGALVFGAVVRFPRA